MIRHNGITIDRKRRIIASTQGEIYLSPRPFKVAFALILGGPISKATILDYLYIDDEDGGPLTASKAVEVYFWKIKKLFSKIGLEICYCGVYRRQYWVVERAGPPPVRPNDIPARWWEGYRPLRLENDASATPSV